MISLDLFNVDLDIDKTISASARRILMEKAEQEIKDCITIAQSTLKTQMDKPDRKKFRITVTKL